VAGVAFGYDLVAAEHRVLETKGGFVKLREVYV
jgi:hypothetical protein